MIRKIFSLTVLILLSLALGLSPASAQGGGGVGVQAALGTAFTYQGQLKDGGSPANGAYDFEFALYDAASGGTQIGSTVSVNDLTVTNGLFTTQLDFGTGAFNGDARYLEIRVRPGSSTGSYTTLSPRQELTATPYALYATSAQWSGLSGVPAGFADGVDNDTTYTAGTGLSLSGTQFSIAATYQLPQSCTNGQIAQWGGTAWTCANASTGDITGVTAGTGLTGGGTSGDVTLNVNFAGSGSATTAARSDHNHDTFYWRLTGNAGTNPSSNFLGTTDNQALELRVNNARALRIEPNATSPNLIGGYSGNSVTGGVVGATIGGGGASGATNRVTDDYGTVGGGANNRAGDNAGATNDAPYATVGGGLQNTASNSAATVGGGWQNTASGYYVTVGGGLSNTASGYAATVGGGDSNSASGNEATVGGGDSNSASGGAATVGGGGSNNASGNYATVGGGLQNTASNSAATVGGGYNNTASGADATIAGGNGNQASGDRATVGGGQNNAASGYAPTVGGGWQNTASGYYVTVGGGEWNTASGYAATVGGGDSNSASGYYVTVGGGESNTASGWYATVGGGANNAAAGDYSFVVGRRAKNTDVNNDGVFLFADSNNFDFPSTAANQFRVRATGGAQFVSGIDGSGNPNAGVQLAAGGGSWSSISDRAVKENFADVNSREILARVAALPIQTWNYVSQDDAIRHIGPTAQDFYAAFGVGEDDKHITTIDADGVALAAIQGLYQVVQEKDAEIANLKSQNANLEARLAALERGAGVRASALPGGLASNGLWFALGCLFSAGAFWLGQRRAKGGKR